MEQVVQERMSREELEFARAESLRDLVEERPNLQTLCKSCNSSKGDR